eukprot:7000035-Pyramimonas_sp.AAC.1
MSRGHRCNGSMVLRIRSWLANHTHMGLSLGPSSATMLHTGWLEMGPQEMSYRVFFDLLSNTHDRWPSTPSGTSNG